MFMGSLIERLQKMVADTKEATKEMKISCMAEISQFEVRFYSFAVRKVIVLSHLDDCKTMRFILILICVTAQMKESKCVLYIKEEAEALTKHRLELEELLKAEQSILSGVESEFDIDQARHQTLTKETTGNHCTAAWCTMPTFATLHIH